MSVACLGRHRQRRPRRPTGALAADVAHPPASAAQVRVPGPAPPRRHPARVLVRVVLDAVRLGAGRDDDAVLVVLVPRTVRDADGEAEGPGPRPDGRRRARASTAAASTTAAAPAGPAARDVRRAAGAGRREGAGEV